MKRAEDEARERTKAKGAVHAWEKRPSHRPHSAALILLYFDQKVIPRASLYSVPVLCPPNL